LSNNIADPSEIEKAKQKEDLRRKQELNDIRTVLSNASGKRLMWKLLERCGTYRTIFDADPSKMSYLSGKQDLGHYLMAEIMQADENLLYKLMKENKKGDI
jgi:hypothetical protein